MHRIALAVACLLSTLSLYAQAPARRPAAAAAAPINMTLAVDATQAPQQILHARDRKSVV